MIAAIPSAVLIGVLGIPVSVEVHVSNGLPGFTIVGLPDAAVRESRDRVRAALLSSGLPWPLRRVTVNLAPSGVRKGGAGLDLPIAIGVLVASGELDPDLVQRTAFVGELGLDGSLRGVPGTVVLAEALRAFRLIVPAEVGREAELAGSGDVGLAVGSVDRLDVGSDDRSDDRLDVGSDDRLGDRLDDRLDVGSEHGIEVHCSSSLNSLIAQLDGATAWDVPQEKPGQGRSGAMSASGVASGSVSRIEPPDLADVKGLRLARRALEVAAAGGHHVLLVGPPGSGKTMLANRLAGLLPDLSPDTALETTRIHSVAGLELPLSGRIRRPPFRAPHHGVSPVAMIGGGNSWMRPGEISLAHGGVLFLDEMGEFSATVLDALRQPLEEGLVRVSRARGSTTFPARFILLAAMNPCPCGEGGAPGACRCSDASRERYARRLSGPLLDRFDIAIPVSRPDADDLMGPEAESSAVIAARVAAARRRAGARGVRSNGDLAGSSLDRSIPMDDGALGLLERHLRSGELTARGLHRVRRIARTVADLEDVDGVVREEHVREALLLRCRRELLLGGECR